MNAAPGIEQMPAIILEDISQKLPCEAYLQFCQSNRARRSACDKSWKRTLDAYKKGDEAHMFTDEVYNELLRYDDTLHDDSGRVRFVAACRARKHILKALRNSHPDDVRSVVEGSFVSSLPSISRSFALEMAIANTAVIPILDDILAIRWLKKAVPDEQDFRSRVSYWAETNPGDTSGVTSPSALDVFLSMEGYGDVVEDPGEPSQEYIDDDHWLAILKTSKLLPSKNKQFVLDTLNGLALSSARIRPDMVKLLLESTSVAKDMEVATTAVALFPMVVPFYVPSMPRDERDTLVELALTRDGLVLEHLNQFGFSYTSNRKMVEHAVRQNGLALAHAHEYFRYYTKENKQLIDHAVDQNPQKWTAVKTIRYDLEDPVVG